MELERIPGKETKVIGVSKVVIPTLLHPEVPYFVLVLEDENGNKWAQKTIQEYQINDEWIPLNSRYSAKQNKNAVAIWRIKYDILEAIEKAIGLVGGLNVNSETKVLILPTLISPKHPYLAANTNPKFLKGIIEYLTKIGGQAKNIKVAAQSFDETPIEASAKKSGLLDVCLKNKVQVLDLAKGNFVKKEKDRFAFQISEEVFNSNLIINLPILKLDFQLGVKGAIENSLKFLEKESYFSLRRQYSQEEIMEKLQGAFPNYLTVADAQTIQKANGLTALLGIILVGFNSINLDRVFAEIAALKELPECLKKVKIENIPITGRAIGEVKYSIKN